MAETPLTTRLAAAFRLVNSSNGIWLVAFLVVAPKTPARYTTAS